jgi:general secretion pathway protein C
VNGAANGFEVFAVRPGSIIARLGLQNGDVLRSMNGYVLNGLDQALEVYGRLRSVSSLEVEIERRGRVMSLHYRIDE